MIAVVPAFFAPLQSLLAFLPQIAIALLAGATALFRPQVYRWIWTQAKARRLVTGAVLLTAVGGSAAAIGWNRMHPPVAPTVAEGASWPTFHGGPQRLGGDGSPVGANPGKIWTFRKKLNPDRFSSSPAIWAGRVYAGCDDGVVYCFNAANGEVLWECAVNHTVFSSPVVSDGRVYFGEGLHSDKDAKLTCADALTGKKLWEFQTLSHIEDAPTIADGRCYFGAGDDGLYCLDAVTGALIWQAKGMHVDSSPLLTEGLLLVTAGYKPKGIAAFDAATGTQKWFTDLPSSCWAAPTLGPVGAIVGCGDGDFVRKDPNPQAAVLCVDVQGGGIVWRHSLADAVLASVLVSGDRAFIGDRSGRFSCLDARTGASVWTTLIGATICSSAALAGDCVVFGEQDGNLQALRIADGSQAWAFTANFVSVEGGIDSSPAVWEGRIYFGSDNRTFYCIGTK